MLRDTVYIFTTADFPLTDANDVPANNLAAVRVATLPAAGTLSHNGNSVTPGQVVLAGDVAAGKLKFTPAASTTGSPYASFTFQVQDDGGTANGGVDLDPTPNTLTIHVVTTSCPPSGTSRIVTTVEDFAYTLNAADFGFNETCDTSGLRAVKITTLPSAGTLTNGVATVAAGQFIPAGDIAAGQLRFTPALNAEGAPYTTFTFQVQDNGGTADGRIDLDPFPKSVTIHVTPVNDAPVSANVQRTINEDYQYTFSVGDFSFADPNDLPPDAFLSVIITSLPQSGTLTLAGSPVLPLTVVPISSIQNGLLRFTPYANFNSALSPSPSFTFKVRDTGGVAFGGLDTSVSNSTLTINVNSLNDAPYGSDSFVTTNEDVPYNFNVSNFGFIDAYDSPLLNTLTAIRITTIPNCGMLFLNNNSVAPGQWIPVSMIGQLQFVPAPNANGVSYATFTFQARDDGGTANGGMDTSVTHSTMTIRVQSVNDPPAGASGSIATYPSSVTPTYVLRASDFAFVDPNDSPPNALQNVHITSLNVAFGSLRLAGSPVAAGLVVRKIDVDAGMLVYHTPLLVPPAPDSFSFRVQDDGGTANGGVDVDPVARTLTFNISAGANRQPSGGDHVVSDALEDTTYPFRAVDFPFSDVEFNALKAVRITTLPHLGSLVLRNGFGDTPVVPGQFISAADVAAGNLRFLANPNASGTPYTQFTFQVQDDGGTAVVLGVPGIDLDPTPNTQTINVLPVNDPPGGADRLIGPRIEATYTFAMSDFPFSDPNDTPGNSLAGVKIGSLPANGTLIVNGAPAALGQFVPAANIAAGQFQFAPASGSLCGPGDAFNFQVKDDGGTADGGVDLDPAANTISFLPFLGMPNHAPSGRSKSVTTLEDSSHAFRIADFGFDDAGEPANNLLAVKISSLPALGTLHNNGVTVAAGQFISVLDIVTGIFIFTPPSNAAGLSFASFTFQVGDDGGGGGCLGSDLDPTPDTITINVIPVNDPPICTFQPFPPVTDESGAQTIEAWITCIPGPANEAVQQLSFAVSTATPERFLVAPAVDGEGTLRFTPRPNLRGQATISVSVHDDGGTANGGMDLAGPYELSFPITKPRPWYNVINGLDVTADGVVAAGDALAVINYLNAFGPKSVSPSTPIGMLFYDANGDNVVAAGDALAVINQINAFVLPPPSGAAPSQSEDADLLTILSLDVATHRRRRQ
jgi:hypothetical protein